MAKIINLRPFTEFLKSQQTGSFLLIISVVISLLVANVGFYDEFHSLLDYSFGYRPLNLYYSTEIWINDGLMAVFFLLVGLEIKRELLEGELSTVKKATVPVFAALGGMLVPALIYFLFNSGTATVNGWGIPMATDIAFALAVISMLGKKVPTSLKVFLSALAIVDDLGAIIVIAIFYTKELHFNYFLYSGIIIILLILLNTSGVKKLVFYIVPGLFLWYFIHHSGIHATIAGVILAFTIPTNPFKEESPLESLEHKITVPVNYFIMPLFALVNTNIRFHGDMVDSLSTPLGLGIIFGLLLGKPIGISLFTYLSIRLGFGVLPARSTWRHIIGSGMLAGIGFTMSVFITLLSFEAAEYHNGAKFSILVASLIAGISGYSYLSRVYRKGPYVTS